MPTLQDLDNLILECRRLVELEQEDPKQLDFLLQLRKDLEDADPSTWAMIDEVFEHLPRDSADQTLQILKGHLLLERKVREFVRERVPNPKVLEKARLSTFQVIHLGKAMCLDNDETKWLWEKILEVNHIRNDLAHNLVLKDSKKRIARLIDDIAKTQGLASITIGGAIAKLYGMLKGLCDLAREDQFRNH